MELFLAKLDWMDSFMPQDVLVVAKNVEDAIKKVREKYKDHKSFCYVRTAERLDMQVDAIIHSKGYVSFG